MPLFLLTFFYLSLIAIWLVLRRIGSIPVPIWVNIDKEFLRNFFEKIWSIQKKAVPLQANLDKSVAW